MITRRGLRRKARQQPFADKRRRLRLRTRLEKAMDFVNPYISLEDRDKFVGVLEMAADAAMNRVVDEVADSYGAWAQAAESDRDRYERALRELWEHPEFNRNMFRWVADMLGVTE